MSTCLLSSHYFGMSHSHSIDHAINTPVRNIWFVGSFVQVADRCVFSCLWLILNFQTVAACYRESLLLTKLSSLTPPIGLCNMTRGGGVEVYIAQWSQLSIEIHNMNAIALHSRFFLTPSVNKPLEPVIQSAYVHLYSMYIKAYYA